MPLSRSRSATLEAFESAGVTLKEFWADYAENTEEGAVLKRNEAGCVFSKGIWLQCL